MWGCGSGMRQGGEGLSMPKVLRVELTSDQEREVRERLRARDLTPGTRLRLERIRLMGRGLTVPEVADLLECNDVCVVRSTASRPAGSTR